jgi:hypothetical protein
MSTLASKLRQLLRLALLAATSARLPRSVEPQSTTFVGWERGNAAALDHCLQEEEFVNTTAVQAG